MSLTPGLASAATRHIEEIKEVKPSAKRLLLQLLAFAHGGSFGSRNFDGFRSRALADRRRRRLSATLSFNDEILIGR
jgi:hypothetical protein